MPLQVCYASGAGEWRAKGEGVPAWAAVCRPSSGSERPVWRRDWRYQPVTAAS